MINRKCSCCGAGFASGKEYGNEWIQITIEDLPLGLCEFCNPSNEKWYLPNKNCHNK